jgi:hypothetical protein
MVRSSTGMLRHSSNQLPPNARYGRPFAAPGTSIQLPSVLFAKYRAAGMQSGLIDRAVRWGNRGILPSNHAISSSPSDPQIISSGNSVISPWSMVCSPRDIVFEPSDMECSSRGIAYPSRRFGLIVVRVWLSNRRLETSHQRVRSPRLVT